MQEYFDRLDEQLRQAYKLGQQARQKGYDPEEKIDIPVAKGISERVEGLISAAAPQILNSGVAKRIDKLEKEYGSLDWRVALKIAEEVAFQKFCKFENKLKAMETGVRVGLAYITLGVISAPLEGFIELQIKKRQDNKEFVSILFAGPIRAAGGTAEAVSLILADYVRLKMGYDRYDPTEKEVKRFVTEVRDYHERVTNLQYLPSEEEIVFLVKNLAVEINGDPTEEKEVSNYKDLPRIHTNRLRGGLCLVLAEGLAQKAPKVFKQVNKWGKSFNLEWGFLEEFLQIQKKIKAKSKKPGANTEKISPNYTFIKDLVAGRPILTYPMRDGGFRLRYGRTRHTGLAAAAIHPATMVVLQGYIATGTQLKIERPGKAAAIVPCESIDGPIVKLKDKTVLQLTSEKMAKIHAEEVEQILFMGDILFNYGDFSENGHRLIPPGYCSEWWIKDVEKAVIDLFGSLAIDKLAELLSVREEHLEILFKEPIGSKISFRLAKEISIKLNVPLHPDFIYYWKILSEKELFILISWFQRARLQKEEGKLSKIILEYQEQGKQALERSGIPHLFVNKEFVVIEKSHAEVLNYFFIENKDKFQTKETGAKNALVVLDSTFSLKIKDKCGTFIGARMGRPEKAKMRKLKGSPHVLFPVGEEGGRLRSFQAALVGGKVSGNFPVCYCQKCKKETILSVCEECGAKTERRWYCEGCKTVSNKKCEKVNQETGQKHRAHSFRNQQININHYFVKALSKLKTKIYPDLIKGVKGTSNKDHTPEHLIKGILRAKHSIYVNKDGTTRYDMIEMPVTHFTPQEIGTSVLRLKELGYEKDLFGKELTNTDQMLEIFPQDIILPDCIDSPDELSSDVLFRIANFIDELLIKLYDLSPYYCLKSKKDLIGHLVMGLAPHTSAGTIGRIIGFSKTQGMYTHPLFHAAMRRNCDGDEACVILLMDGLLNFSRSFLPDKRGSRTMDAPLVLTSILIPGEVDDEVHGLDIVDSYPLEFYAAAEQYKNPWDVKVFQIDDYLGTYKQYEGMRYTHETKDMNSGTLCSSYKTLPSMQEKLTGQMELAVKICAVDAAGVASLVINKHFIRDIKGNLRKYSIQQFRCVKCNAKYRRPPLAGRCTDCRGKLIFTISKGSIIKYMEPSLSLAEKFNVPPYIRQTLDMTQKRIDSVLGREKEIQQGLGQWFTA